MTHSKRVQIATRCSYVNAGPNLRGIGFLIPHSVITCSQPSALVCSYVVFGILSTSKVPKYDAALRYAKCPREKESDYYEYEHEYEHE